MSGLAETILNVISPFIYGIVMAYLVCPIYNFTVGGIYRLLNRGPNKLKLDMTISKICGSVVSLAVIVIVVAGVLWMVIPGLFDSITMVVEMLPAGFKSLNEWVNHAFANLPIAQEAFDKWSDNITSYALNFATNTILPKSGDVATAVSGAMINAFGVFFNFLLGVIICIYFLNMKDILAAQAKKLILALFRESTAEEILLGADYTNKTFGGFISGKILDSLIVGVICFIVMTVFGWEYSL
ncbi:MAG: AI-2E family transporter, partial [Bacillota bacterium]|nr:AI-2E family transporter [Bacillota bacterium]